MVDITINADKSYVRLNNGNTIEHDEEGTVFIRNITPQLDDPARTHTHYTNIQSVSNEGTSMIELIKRGIETGNWEGRSKHTLVRSGQPGCYRYFPVPLLFEDDDSIRRASQEAGLHTHPDGWYKYRRNLVSQLVGLPQIP